MSNESDNKLERLQSWYAARCDGTWEHEFGIRIDTLDNPGWLVEIDLHGTNLANRRFHQVAEERTPNDWFNATVEDNVFRGRGGVTNLDDVLKLFLEWCNSESE